MLQHPSFILLISKHEKVLISIDTTLAISVSQNALNSVKLRECWFKMKSWVYVLLLKRLCLCVLGFALVCSNKVQCYYKSTGSLLKYNLIFSQLIESRLFNPFSNEKVHLVFCNNTINSPVPFVHNHYVPLTICPQQKYLK